MPATACRLRSENCQARSLAGHKLIKGMASQIEANGDPALLDDAAKMLLDQAQILEGRPPASLTEFAKRMTRLMERGLSA